MLFDHNGHYIVGSFADRHPIIGSIILTVVMLYIIGGAAAFTVAMLR